MALAAIHFCHALGLRIKQEITIHVVEGFASRYTDEQHNKPSHMDVAKELLSRWRDGQELLIPQVVGSIVSVTGILSGDSSHGVSGILRVPDGLKSTAL
jgi:hypothetical protein